jgi:TolA-binding protein
VTEPIKLPEALRLADSVHLGYRVGWQRECAAELRRLHAEIDRLRDGLLAWQTAAVDIRQQLKKAEAEVERLRADAERYRWLRKCARATSEHWGGRWSLVTEGPAPENATSAGIDAAIDAARAALKEPK